MRTLVDYVRSGEPDLTNRQMALMMIVYILPGPHTVRGLADKLNVSKPVITRALNKPGALGYLRRERDDADRRNIFVTRTAQGALFQIGRAWCRERGCREVESWGGSDVCKKK